MRPLPVASPPTNRQVPTGIRLDASAVTTLSATLITGGSPWRVRRLGPTARATFDRWLAGDALQSRDVALARALIDQGLVHPRFSIVDDVTGLDVVVPVRDDVAHLGRLLGELHGFAVTVVDDGSLDAPAVAACAEGAGARLVRLPENRGPGAARNAGVAETTRPLLWFIDVDVTLEDARRVATSLVAALGDPLVAASAPRIRGAAGGRLRERFEREFSPLDLGAPSGLVTAGGARAYVPSACLVVRRDALGAGFDEALRVGEDVDLVWRLLDAGWLVRYDGAVSVAHEARATWLAWWAQRVAYGASAAALGARHGSRVAPVVLDESTLAITTSLAAGQLTTAALAVIWLAGRIHRALPVEARRTRATGTLLARALAGTIGPSARAVVRTYGPLVLAAAVAPRLRRRALALFALGTLWRFRAHRVTVGDVALGVADDVAYALGVWRGAARARDTTALTPRFGPGESRNARRRAR